MRRALLVVGCAVPLALAGSAKAFAQEVCDADAATSCADDASSSSPSDFGGFDVAFGVWRRRPSSRGDSTGSSPSGATWKIPTSLLAPIDETLIDGQIRLRFPKPLYFGFDVAAGWVRAGAINGTYDDYGVPTAFATSGHGLALIFAGIAGATIFESSHIDVRTEIALGFDILSVDLTTPQGCVDADGNPTTCSLTRFGLIAEPRVAADFWLTRWLQLSAWGGVDAWPLGGVSLGGSFVFASRPGPT